VSRSDSWLLTTVPLFHGKNSVLPVVQVGQVVLGAAYIATKLNFNSVSADTALGSQLLVLCYLWKSFFSGQTKTTTDLMLMFL
jgi:hypothetical protein